jgi:putative transposase
MTSRLRHCQPGHSYHVLNRGTKRQQLFATDQQYLAFEHLLEQTMARTPLTIFTYELMPNHWHFIVRPDRKEDLSEFFQYLSGTHAKRFHMARGSSGEGHVYQDRFKSFPAEEDGHLLSLARYVERNAKSAGLVQRAEDWRWSGLWRRVHELDHFLASVWPIPRPKNWIERVNQPLTGGELVAIQASVRRGRPLGTPDWTKRTVDELGLQHTMRSRGRPQICRAAR